MTNIPNVSFMNNGAYMPPSATYRSNNQVLNSSGLSAADNSTYNFNPFPGRVVEKVKPHKEKKTYSGLSDEELAALDTSGVISQAAGTAKDTIFYQTQKYGAIGFGLSAMFSTLRYILREPYVGDVVTKTPALWTYTAKDGKQYDLRKEAFKEHKDLIASAMVPIFMYEEKGKEDLKKINEWNNAPVDKKPFSKIEFEKIKRKLELLREDINNKSPHLYSYWLSENKNKYGKYIENFDNWIGWISDHFGKHSKNKYPSKAVKDKFDLKSIYIFLGKRDSVEKEDLPLNILCQNIFYHILEFKTKKLQETKEVSSFSAKMMNIRRKLLYRYREYGIGGESFLNGIEALTLGLGKMPLLMTTIMPFTSSYLYALVDSSTKVVPKFSSWTKFELGQNKINLFVTLSKAASTALKRTDDIFVFLTNWGLGIGRKHFRDIAEENSPLVLSLMKFMKTGSFKLEDTDFTKLDMNSKFLKHEYRAKNMQMGDRFRRAFAKWQVKFLGDIFVIGLGTFIIQTLYMLYKKAQLGSNNNSVKDDNNLIEMNKKK